MIKFFQNQRRKTLGNYLIYAAGEIVLVVIGILIALYINNISEASKHEEKITAILKEVQLDLLDDIQKAEEVIQYYELRDSMIMSVFSGQMTREAYQNQKNFSYFSLTLSLNDFQFHDNGFSNLMRNSDIIPERFDELLNHLKKIYINDKKRIEKNFEFINSFALDNVDYLSTEKRWFHLLTSGQINDEILDYFQHDPFYKNKLMQYQVLAIQNLLPVLRDFKYAAGLTYREIAAEIDPEAPLPNIVGNQSPNLSADKLEKFVGQYEAKQQMRATISLENGNLYMQAKGQPKFELSVKSATQFHHPMLGLEIEFQLEEDQQVTQFVLKQRGMEVSFLRLEED